MTLIVAIIILALIFDFINGFHDAANSIATVVSTKVLTPFQAVVWAAFFNFVAYFIFSDHAVANTIGKTVNQEFITLGVILAGLVAAIFWNLLTWWFGIPSSSSHTLIGGFAGAAVCHAFIKTGTISWSNIVDNKIIWSTVLFIFLAPIIGMAVSMFITYVTIVRNLWIRIFIIFLATFGAVLLFDVFEHTKMEDAITKFYKVDKYKKEIHYLEDQLEDAPADSKLQAKLDEVNSKYEKVKPTYEKAMALVQNYDKFGAISIAKQASDLHLLDEIGINMLKEEIRNANGYLVLEAEAPNHPEKLGLFNEAKEKSELYKEPITQYLKGQMSIEEVIPALNAIYPIAPTRLDVVKAKLTKFNVENTLAKILKSKDNTAIVWGIILTAIFFSLVYLYVEAYKTPTAYKISEMFKKLQLFSSAAFSVGHGGNDAQKVMGIIGAALIANGTIQEFSQLPFWVPFACYTAIGVGTMSGGWKIVKTMGTKITKVTPLEGVSAETAGAFTLFFTGQMGIPVSTTHTITGSIIGVGAIKRLSAVRWGVTINLLWAWILTIPVSALVAALFYYIIHLMGIL